MLLFFEPAVVAKTKVTLLQSPSLPSFDFDIWTTDAARLIFLLFYNTELGVKRTIRYKSRFFGVTLDVS